MSRRALLAEFHEAHSRMVAFNAQMVGRDGSMIPTRELQEFGRLHEEARRLGALLGVDV